MKEQKVRAFFSIGFFFLLSLLSKNWIEFIIINIFGVMTAIVIMLEERNLKEVEE